jgi:hypothetical protein
MEFRHLTYYLCIPKSIHIDDSSKSESQLFCITIKVLRIYRLGNFAFWTRVQNRIQTFTHILTPVSFFFKLIIDIYFHFSINIFSCDLHLSISFIFKFTHDMTGDRQCHHRDGLALLELFKGTKTRNIFAFLIKF